MLRLLFSCTCLSLPASLFPLTARRGDLPTTSVGFLDLRCFVLMIVGNMRADCTGLDGLICSR
jgi:hypothetical protein